MTTIAAPLVETPHTLTEPLRVDAFRRGTSYQNRRSRGTNDWLLILTLSGAGRVGTTNASLTVSTGDVLLYEPHTPQIYGTDPTAGHWHLLWAHFYPRPHWKAWLKWPARQKGLLVTTINDPHIQQHIRTALQAAVRLNRQPLASAADLALNALELALLWIHQVSRHTGIDDRIRRASDILAEEINQPLVLADLARRCGLSLSRFAHLFREEIGISPQQYLEKIRMERAAQMLRSTSLSIGEIAAESGYTNAFYFSNRFKNAFHQSPSSYRWAVNQLKPQ